MASSTKVGKRTAQDIRRAAFVLSDYLLPEERAELDGLIFDPEAERDRYREDPRAFCIEVLNVKPTSYQVRIMESLLKKRRVCVRGPHGMGKTSSSAMVILWFIAVHEECKIATTASAWRQLSDFLWPEIHKYAMKANWWRVGLVVRPGKELLATRLEFSKTRFAFALSSDDEAKIEGAHAPNILYVFDEAKTIPAAIWDAAEGAMSSGNAYALACSTPGESSGRFFEIQMKKFSHWHAMAVTTEEAVMAKRITQEWVDQCREQWGEDSVLFRRRVLGNFAEDSAETVIPLHLIERANQLWRDLWDQVGALTASGYEQQEAEQLVWGDLTHLGVDPARFGSNQTGYAYRFGMHTKRIERTVREDLMETTGRIVAATANNTATTNIDVNGLGAGVFDRLNEMWRHKQWRPTDVQRVPCVPINSSSGTKLRDKSGQLQFHRLRDAVWWKFRERLEAGGIALPPDDMLTGDLVAFKYGYTSAGKIEIEHKEDVAKRIGRSPDTGDAVILAYAPDSEPYRLQLGFF